jgi:adenylate kinase
MYKVIYMTGAPAAGKSSTAAMLRTRIPGLQVFEFGARLTALAAESQSQPLTQDQVRAKSATIITKEHVERLDEILINFCNAERKHNHVLIDSHPVTKEQFGFRITAFSIDQIRRIAPSEIWVLYAAPGETIRRIEADPRGRPTPTSWQADFHTQLQSNVAATYAIATGTAVYLFDTAVPREQLLETLLRRLH